MHADLAVEQVGALQEDRERAGRPALDSPGDLAIHARVARRRRLERGRRVSARETRMARERARRTARARPRPRGPSAPATCAGGCSPLASLPRTGSPKSRTPARHPRASTSHCASMPRKRAAACAEVLHQEFALGLDLALVRRRGRRSPSPSLVHARRVDSSPSPRLANTPTLQSHVTRHLAQAHGRRCARLPCAASDRRCRTVPVAWCAPFEYSSSIEGARCACVRAYAARR